ncbi:unnamed protein product [Meloidogyne enterolobii]|uniref:Uncharacterized protein n=1 Tax=Meloidogyne enterolobii TaxID=390850 RepID=A0ACB0ZLA0_MELEN
MYFLLLQQLEQQLLCNLFLLQIQQHHSHWQAIKFLKLEKKRLVDPQIVTTKDQQAIT